LKQNCCMCGETLDPENMSRCRVCGGYFHMAWSTDAQVKNCGSYWLNNVSCGLSFVCNSCQAEAMSSSPENPTI